MTSDAQIQLTKGKFAIVDAEYYEHLNQWKWHISSSGYARRQDYTLGYKKPKMIFMHRLINNTPDGFDTDHIDGDKLNNQKSNLRTASRSQNSANKPARAKYKGVVKRAGENSYQVMIMKDRKRRCVGTYKTEIDAALAYNAAAIELYGEFAVLNKIAAFREGVKG